MLILASILFSRSSNTSVSPIPDAVFTSSFPKDAELMPLCSRQPIQIIWTCVATILAASWVSVHPNIPNPKESTIKKTLRRIELMIWAIITPELIIYWAMRQWYGARYMKRKFAELEVRDTEPEPLTRKILFRLKKLRYQLLRFRGRKDRKLIPLTRKIPRRIKEVKWTKTHGFFLQMGGFMLREEGNKDRVLGWRTLVKYYKQGRLDLSDVTEDRINDHSKADGFAKGLALLQMFWFIAQCIARFFDKHLILTELELATAALAVLSLFMYFLWWNKPFNASVPIIITLLPAKMDSQSKDDANSRQESVNVADSIDTSLPISDMINPLISYARRPVEATQPDLHRVDEEIMETFNNFAAFPQMFPLLPPSPTQSAHPQVQFASSSQPADRPSSPTMEGDKSSDGFQLQWFLFMRIAEILDKYDVEADSIDDSDPDESAVTCVATFYSIDIISVAAHLLLIGFLAAALFGSIHCIGWSSKIMYTSHAVALTWRIASAIITASPLMWCLSVIFAFAYVECKDGSVLKKILDDFGTLTVSVSATSIPLYIVARLALLVLAFVELRDIPPGALASIQWANVLPSIH